MAHKTRKHTCIHCTYYQIRFKPKQKAKQLTNAGWKRLNRKWICPQCFNSHTSNENPIFDYIIKSISQIRKNPS